MKGETLCTDVILFKVFVYQYYQHMQIDFKRCISRDVPGGQVVKIPCFQSRGRGFDPCLEKYDPACQVVQSKLKLKNKAYGL